MIVAHLSDLHLGYRAFERQEGGRNVREQDVERAFRRALSLLAETEPGLVIVSGDVFDRPDPPSTAIVALAQGLEQLRRALPRVPVVMIAGSSDTPLRAGGPGALAAFETVPDVEAAHETMRSVRLLDGELHVLLVPNQALLDPDPPPLKPHSDARWNVLVLRARVARAEPPGRQQPRGVETRPAIPFDPTGWDYVALGYRHGHRLVAPRMAYAGSLERIGPDPWREAAEEKGFVTVDLASGAVRFERVQGRPVVELARIRIRPGDPEHTARRIREVVRETPGGIEGKIVRMRLEGQPGGVPPRLDAALLEDLRERALHLSVRVDWPLPPGEERDVGHHVAEWTTRDESATDLARLLGLELPEAVS